MVQKKEVKIVQSPSKENGNIVFFHVNYLLTCDYVSSRLQQVESEIQTLLADLLDIPGIQFASIERYKVKIERSEAVDWPEIAAGVEAAITKAVEAIESSRRLNLQ